MKKKKKRNGMIFELVEQIKTDKITFTVFVLLRAFVIAAMVLSALNRNYENLFVCSLSLVLFLVPPFVEKKFAISLPTALEVIILLFIFAAEILGEINSYYTRFPLWDTMLHTINGFLCAAIGFAMVDILNTNTRVKFQLSPFYLSVVAFCFSMTIGVLWEFFEFFCDMVLHTDMQKDFVVDIISSVALNPDGLNKPVVIKGITSTAVNGVPLEINGYLDIGIIDTMKDLIVNFVGAAVFSIIGFFYVRSRGKNKFAKNFIPTVDRNNTEENGGE
ncbi:MAG: hypothetical protein J6N52_12575 [Clostridia bacterium]|nr:hypothetical protein [Clostridia bacterium]